MRITASGGQALSIGLHDGAACTLNSAKTVTAKGKGPNADPVTVNNTATLQTQVGASAPA